MPERKIPRFSSEAEEAKWWYGNRRKLDRRFAEAVRQGKLKRLTKATLAARVAASRVISIRLPEADLALARKQAAEAGLPYQTYIKPLLHRALARQADARRRG